MTQWIVRVSAFFLLAGAAFAQGNEDVLRELKALRDRVSALESENADLRSSQAALAAKIETEDGQALEAAVNGLGTTWRAGTTVKSAADPVTLTGEFRFRNTWSLGDNAAGTTPPGTIFSNDVDDEHDGSYTDSLVRLGFQYDFTRDVTAFAELQARWAFGQGASTNSALFQAAQGSKGAPPISDNGSTLVVHTHQAWLEVRNIFGAPELSSRTGRQEIALGNQLQFGNADWFNGYSFDGTRWDWVSESFSITAFIAKLASRDGDLNQTPSFFNSHDDDELYSLYFTLKSIPNHQLDVYWIYINGHGGAFDNGSGASTGSLGNFVGDPAFIGSAYYHTIGARIGGTFPDVFAGLDWNVEGAYQFGDNKAPGENVDIDAFTVEAEVGLTFSQESRFRVYVRFLYAEGPEFDDLGSLDQLGYVTLYPNRHSHAGFRARYGLFDLLPMTNVLSLQGGLHFDPAEAWTLGATFLWATTEEDILLAGGDDYGIEVDVWGEYRFTEALTFGAGLALLFPDDTGEFFFRVDDGVQVLAYLQARLLF